MAREKVWLIAAEACREYGIPRRTFDSKKDLLEGKLHLGRVVYNRRRVELVFRFSEKRIN